MLVKNPYNCSGISNGHPWTEGDLALLDEIDTDERKKVLAWIENHIRPRKTANKGRSSYGLKHCLDADIGIYLTNNQFKDAMLIAGYNPVDSKLLNWNWRIYYSYKGLR